MFGKIVLGATALAASLTVLPAQADAHGYYRPQRHYQSYGYAPPVYYAPRRVYVAPRRVYVHPGYGGGYYDRGYQGSGYYPQSYGGRGYSRGYYPQSYGGRGYDRYDRYGDNRGYRGRCGSGTTGAIIGGAGGALLGRGIARGGRDHYGYRRRGNGTTGALIGGVAGALIGREIDRSC